ncbi:MULTISPECIES: hypothetical protein [Streptomyces]|uniref:hypothetical protein n=1 Tax=Streptomyces TaxID=1883 RepID=UPI00131A5410|nr:MULTISPECIES: hypothetical protein [Streptomyces]
MRRDETPAEKEAAWDRLFQGPRPTRELEAKWADGLARNPATPDDALPGLLGRSAHLLWRRLPTAVVDAAIGHPEWEVRRLLAEAQPDLAADQWSRLILGEQRPGRRWALTMIAADRRAGSPGRRTRISPPTRPPWSERRPPV